ncbi:MAG: NAD-dependent epimerase/dehydratase family protein [Rhodoglobus sp.]
MPTSLRALLTGAGGMLGSSIAQQWAINRPNDDLVLVTRQDRDLRDREATAALVDQVAPDLIIHAAAKVGGIAAKLAEPTAYLLDNMLLDTSVISAALSAAVPNLLYVGSAAFYPEHYRQPFEEGDLLCGPLEKANESYAIAKIAGAKLCEYASSQFGYSYRVVVPSNLYGPNDDYSLSHGHLIAATIAKIHQAHLRGEEAVVVWGDGSARREFTFSDDLAAWLVSQADSLSQWPNLVNVGAGVDHTITEYYEAARDVIGYAGRFEYDLSKPAGMHQRLLDSRAAQALGWVPSTSLREGMAQIYQRYALLSAGKV